eukprot:g38997.t1
MDIWPRKQVHHFSDIGYVHEPYVRNVASGIQPRQAAQGAGVLAELQEDFVRMMNKDKWFAEHALTKPDESIERFNVSSWLNVGDGMCMQCGSLPLEAATVQHCGAIELALLLGDKHALHWRREQPQTNQSREALSVTGRFRLHVSEAMDLQPLWSIRRSGSLGMDIVSSLELPAGPEGQHRQLWLFGDTFLGQYDPKTCSKVYREFPRHSLAVTSFAKPASPQDPAQSATWNGTKLAEDSCLFWKLDEHFRPSGLLGPEGAQNRLWRWFFGGLSVENDLWLVGQQLELNGESWLQPVASVLVHIPNSHQPVSAWRYRLVEIPHNMFSNVVIKFSLTFANAIFRDPSEPGIVFILEVLEESRVWIPVGRFKDNPRLVPLHLFEHWWRRNYGNMAAVTTALGSFLFLYHWGQRHLHVFKRKPDTALEESTA